MISLVWLSAWNEVLDLETVVLDDADEVLDFSLTEEEGEFVVTPYFEPTIINPGIAGIAARPGRYAAVVERLPGETMAEELARGRLTGLPTELGQVDCKLEFACLPPNDDEVLKAAADALRVGEVDYDPDAPLEDREAAEMYDPLFYDGDATEDPTTVLLARRQMWRWDRKTLTPHLVHLTDGVVEHQVDDILEGEDSFSLRVDTPPKKITKLRLIAGFTQYAHGIQTANRIGSFTSYTYQDFLNAVPKPGDPIGANSGWKFHSFEVSTTPMSPDYMYVPSGTWMSYDCAVILKGQLIDYSWRAAFEYQQAREEIIDISMPAAIQDVLGDTKTETVDVIQLGQLNLDLVTPEWEYEDPDTLEVRHYNVGDRVQANGRVWSALVEHDATEKFLAVDEEGIELWLRVAKRSAMRDSRSPGFANLDRGTRAIRHGIRRLDREVCLLSRAAEISFLVPYETAKSMTTADTARVQHRLIPGGEAVGKISSIQLSINSSRMGRVIVLAPIGDGTAKPVAGEGQQYAGDVVYSVDLGRLSTPVDAFTLESVAPYVNDIVNPGGEQSITGHWAAGAGLDPIKAIGAIPTQYHIGFPTLRQEDLLRRRVKVTCAPTYIPKGIDIAPDLGEP